MAQGPIELIAQAGIAGILLWYIVQRLDKIQDAIASLVQLYTIIITSLPDVKKRAKEDAEAINRKVHEK
jgi:hypothetical protein